VIAKSTAASSQLTSAKESSSMLLNNVKKYLPDASMVIGIITPNGYGNASKTNSTKVNGNTIFDCFHYKDIYYNAFS
jgi:hypothetical protein